VYTLSHGSWSSPVIVDNQLIVASNDGLLRRFDLANPRAPRLVWTFKVGTGNLEATPAVWEGMIYVGNRDGFMYAIGELDG
jgi:outer membrane protein assembly factor BamB